MWLLHLEKIRRKTVCLMWRGKCSLKMHKALYLAIFLYSEKFSSCMFYCTLHTWSCWGTIHYVQCLTDHRLPHSVIYSHISVNPVHLSKLFCTVRVFFFMSACLRLYERLSAADCATIQRRELWPEVWRQTGSPVFVGTSYWWVWKLKRQDKECAWLDAEWVRGGGISL